jgi:hypothetical protein
MPAGASATIVRDAAMSLPSYVHPDTGAGPGGREMRAGADAPRRGYRAA